MINHYVVELSCLYLVCKSSGRFNCRLMNCFARRSENLSIDADESLPRMSISEMSEHHGFIFTQVWTDVKIIKYMIKDHLNSLNITITRHNKKQTKLNILLSKQMNVSISKNTTVDIFLSMPSYTIAMNELWAQFFPKYFQYEYLETFHAR